MTIELHDLCLSGLDPQDPLGYLASLGVLAAATDQSYRRGWPAPSLAFSMGAAPLPTLRSGFGDLDTLVSMLHEDLQEIAGDDAPSRDRFVAFSYPDDKGKSVHDLKPPLAELRDRIGPVLAHSKFDNRRTADWFAATLTDVAVDGNGAGKPFALHFTAGQQRFLNVALELLDGVKKEAPVGPDDLHEALEGPWRDRRALKVFSWSPMQDRAYALRSSDPSTDAKRGTPGADWLAFRGLPLISSAPIKDRIQTGGVRGSWKSASFTYPVWPMPLSADGVASLLRHRDLISSSPHTSLTWPAGAERWTCKITRSDQGGYGAFSRPSRR